MNTIHHTLMGFCWWDIPAIIILVALAVLFVIRHRKLKKIEKELEDQLSGVYADEVEKQ